jgi:hypothetical protein
MAEDFDPEIWRYVRRQTKTRRRFALIYGVGVFGGAPALMLIASQIAWGTFNIAIAAAELTLGIIGGYFGGLKTWDYNEKEIPPDEGPISTSAPKLDDASDSS